MRVLTVVAACFVALSCTDATDPGPAWVGQWCSTAQLEQNGAEYSDGAWRVQLFLNHTEWEDRPGASRLEVRSCVDYGCTFLGPESSMTAEGAMSQCRSRARADGYQVF